MSTLPASPPVPQPVLAIDGLALIVTSGHGPLRRAEPSADRSPTGDAELVTRAVKTGEIPVDAIADPILRRLVDDILTRSPAPEFSQVVDHSGVSALANKLGHTFPGRPAFTRRLALVLQMFARWQHGVESIAGDEPRALGHKPNLIVVGRKGSGKSYLLGSVLPAVLPDYLRSLGRAAGPATVVCVDARHIAGGIGPLDRGPAGPGDFLRTLVARGDQDIEHWMDGAPMVVCIDNLEAFWESKTERDQRPAERDGLIASLASVIRGVRCSLLPGTPGHIDRRGIGLVATDRILFIAAARLDQLRSVRGRRTGDAGTSDISISDLVEAGMPLALAQEFSCLLPVPSIFPAAYHRLLENHDHPGFALIEQQALALGASSVELDGVADLLYALTWRSRPDFLRLAQVLAELAANLSELRLVPRAKLVIRPSHIRQLLVRGTVDVETDL